ncbi:hypothetical protein Vretifemale_20846 [Volvox reticuliferus]|uniref:asparaginase n=3 Tax=Volvox reticuliferus TaxID=1737510 RepID=A0A8J4FZZ0_9CHLO|nr:hypothetical protein Vretifemale_20846 [Volvox reticuliferus]
MLDAAAVAHVSRVGVWVTGVSSFLPEALLAELSGLILAGPGTGSLSAALTDQLAPWTALIPVVLATRCATGNNFDDHYYGGSRQKYEARGFLLSDFAHLTPVQARTLLVLRLAAGVYPQYSHLRQDSPPPGSGMCQQPRAKSGSSGGDRDSGEAATADA